MGGKWSREQNAMPRGHAKGGGGRCSLGRLHQPRALAARQAAQRGENNAAEFSSCITATIEPLLGITTVSGTTTTSISSHLQHRESQPHSRGRVDMLFQSSALHPRPPHRALSARQPRKASTTGETAGKSAEPPTAPCSQNGACAGVELAGVLPICG